MFVLCIILFYVYFQYVIAYVTFLRMFFCCLPFVLLCFFLYFMYVCFFFFICFVIFVSFVLFFFFKQKTACEMRISDWSSDVCSSDLITPPPGTNAMALERLAEFWRRLGVNVETMDPEHHDLVLAVTSHLPHLIAYTIVGTASDLEDVTRSGDWKRLVTGKRGSVRVDLGGCRYIKKKKNKITSS